MADLAARGRIGSDPKSRETKNGKAMATTTLAVDVTAYNADDPQTLWLGLVAFGDVAERLSRVRKGDSVSVHGVLTQKPYETSQGEQRDGFSLLVESMVCARPKVGKKRSSQKRTTYDNGVPFDDPLPI